MFEILEQKSQQFTTINNKSCDFIKTFEFKSVILQMSRFQNKSWKTFVKVTISNFFLFPFFAKQSHDFATF